MSNSTKIVIFIGIILSLSALGYLIGRKSEIFACIGALVGFVLCFLIWSFLKSKNKTKTT